MSPRFCMTILRFTIGVTLLLATSSKVGAKQVENTPSRPICQKESLPQNVSPNQLGKTCRNPEKSEANDSGESFTNANSDDLTETKINNVDPSDKDEVVNDTEDLGTNTSVSNSSNQDTDNITDNPSNSEEESNTPSSTQDSHDVNFSLQLNLGGGNEIPADSDTEANLSEPSQSEISPVDPSQTAPTPTNTEGIDSTQVVPSNSQVKEGRQHPNKSEHHQKRHQNAKDHNNRDLRSKHKLEKQFSERDSKSHMKSDKQKKDRRAKLRSERIYQDFPASGKSSIDMKKAIKPSSYRPNHTLKRPTIKLSTPKEPNRNSLNLRRRTQFSAPINRLKKSQRKTGVLRSPSHQNHMKQRFPH
jgi:hypothetical protein